MDFITKLFLYFFIFFYIFFASLFVLLRPLVRVKVEKLNTSRIGHFAANTIRYYIYKQFKKKILKKKNMIKNINQDFICKPLILFH